MYDIRGKGLPANINRYSSQQQKCTSNMKPEQSNGVNIPPSILVCQLRLGRKTAISNWRGQNRKNQSFHIFDGHHCCSHPESLTSRCSRSKPSWAKETCCNKNATPQLCCTYIQMISTKNSRVSPVGNR